jgi:hypothetical protein
MKHCTEIEIKASFLHMTKIQAAIILPMATWGIKENKTAYIK